MNRTCCFTGHRTLPPAGSAEYAALMRALDSAIEKAIDEHGCTAFLAGGAVGFDLLASERVLAYRAKNVIITLTLCCPFTGHDARFSLRDKARWDAVKRRADRTLYLGEHYSPSSYYFRNRYMVEHSDCLIAYVRDLHSGSGQTLSLAKERGLDVILL